MSEQGAIARRAGIVGGLTLASRVLGLLRDTVIGHLFGAGYATDAFFMAFTIPNTFRQLVAEGSLTIAFLPVFSELRAREGEAAGRRFVAEALGLFPLLTAVLVALGMLAAEPLAWLFASGFAQVPGKLELTVTLTRWLFPFLWCAAMVALTMGVLNSLKHFAVPASAPALFNLVEVSVVLAWAWYHGPHIYAVVGGVLAGGLAQVGLQVWGLRRAGVLVRPRLALSPPIRRVLWLMLPALLGTSIYELNILVTRYLVSFLEQGAVSYLYNADRFTQLPLGIFGFAIATAALPSLADQAAAGDRVQFKRTLAFAYRLSMFIIVPSSVALLVLARPITGVVFQHGAFSAAMADHTAAALVCFVVGLGGIALVRQTVQGFFALQDTRTPVACSAVGLALNASAALWLIGPLGFRGAALALGLASWGQLALLLAFLHRRIGALPWAELASSIGRALLAALLMGAIVQGVAWFGRWEQGLTARNAGLLALAVAVGAAAYFALSAALGSAEWRLLADGLRRRLRR